MLPLLLLGRASAALRRFPVVSGGCVGNSSRLLAVTAWPTCAAAAGPGRWLSTARGDDGAPRPTPTPTLLEGISYMKNVPDPQLLPDDQYPAWVFTEFWKEPTLEELKAKGLENMDSEERKRYFKLLNREEIKEKNLLRKNR